MVKYSSKPDCTVFVRGYWPAIYVREGDVWKIRVLTLNESRGLQDRLPYQDGRAVNLGLVYPLVATSSTGSPWGVRRYASAQASFRASSEAWSAKPLAVTRCSRAASQ
jgi:hypothetical protein